MKRLAVKVKKNKYMKYARLYNYEDDASKVSVLDNNLISFKNHRLYGFILSYLESHPGTTELFHSSVREYHFLNTLDPRLSEEVKGKIRLC